MVRSQASIPVSMLSRNGINVIYNCPSDWSDIKGSGLIKESDHVCDTEGEEMNMGLFWVSCSKPGFHFHIVNKSPLHGIDTPTWPIMKQRWFTLLVYIYFEESFHLEIASAASKILHKYIKIA